MCATIGNKKKGEDFLITERSSNVTARTRATKTAESPIKLNDLVTDVRNDWEQ